MKLLLTSCSLALALLAPFARADDNVLTPAESAAGWHLLFDGSTLAGWRSLKSPEPGSGWRAENGMIVRTAASGDLVTSGSYGDFELSIEWKVADETNSGILYRVDLGQDQTYFSGPEYQLLDNLHGGDRFDPKHQAGALYDIVAPPQDYTHPVGTWNLTRIVVQGWHVQHWLNGEKIVDIDLGTPAGRARIAASKFKRWPVYATLARGHIALQDHDGMVSFRNIKLRELPAN